MLDDNQLKKELGNLTEKEQVKFMKLLDTFNHRGGSSSNSKVNRALEAAKYKGGNRIQGGGGLLSGIQNMFGGVTQKFNDLKDFATPKMFKEINQELKEEETNVETKTERNNEANPKESVRESTEEGVKMEGGKLTQNTNTEGPITEDTREELEERVGKLEQSLSLLNDTLNNLNNDENENANENANNTENLNNNTLLKGGAKKKKKKKLSCKSKNKSKSKSKNSKSKNKQKRKTKLQKSKKLK